MWMIWMLNLSWAGGGLDPTAVVVETEAAVAQVDALYREALADAHVERMMCALPRRRALSELSATAQAVALAPVTGVASRRAQEARLGQLADQADSLVEEARRCDLGARRAGGTTIVDVDCGDAPCRPAREPARRWLGRDRGAS